MIVLPPTPVTDSTLNSSDVPENDEPEWAAGSYALGDLVMVTVPNVHRRFESLVAANTTDPVADQLTGGNNWQDIGPTNRYAMFDTLNGTQTVQADIVEVEVTAGSLTNMVAVLNVNAVAVQVIVTDPVDGEVYNVTKNLISNSGINDWYSYLFTPIERDSSVIFSDLPAYALATVRVIITAPADTVQVGVLILGRQTLIGTALHGSSGGTRDYSRKETDDFGNFTVVPRANSKRAEFAVQMLTPRTGFVQDFLNGILTVPSVWIGDEGNTASIVYGYYRDFDIIFSDAVYSDTSIQVEGLT